MLERSLINLERYVRKIYSREPGVHDFRLDFWAIEDDDLFFGFLTNLSANFYELADAHFNAIPIGFKLAYAIFRLEDDYDVNGWTALTNAGEDELPVVIAAYQYLGFDSEAAALSAALQSCRLAPDDDDAAERAYKSVDDIYRDDDIRRTALLKYFKAHANLWEKYDEEN
ncbi:DMP19 family protein [Undibacterium sp. Di27W]|uniref:DMP19 family protein n=1 Tax=Undibacterium sp. Di27W TaxID=3413036 RepID=UPI003BF1FACB